MSDRVLRLGDSGPDVAELQRQIGVSADGSFGPATADAVRFYQGHAGLDPDGVVGPATRAALAHDTRATAIRAMNPNAYASPEDITAGGWYSRARRVDAHPGRVGGNITACALVIHTTDMLEHTFDGLVQRWSGEPGKGDCAHWIIGRTPAQGVVQMVSALRNGNHAGGAPRHGWFGTPRQGVDSLSLTHPNTIALGVEIHAGGYLGRRTPRGFVHKDSGQVVPDNDVKVDSRGIGWHLITPYQLDELGRLVRAVRTILRPMSPGMVVVPSGTYAANGVTWAPTKTPQIVGHVTLDPEQKTDPGPQGIDWINALD